MEITEQHIFFDVSARHKKQALKKIAAYAEQIQVVTDQKKFFKGLRKREEEVTTGFGNGVAIPHAKLKEVIKPSVMIIKFSEEVEWDSLDNQPVRLAIVLAVPDTDAATEHLKLLSQISRQLMHEEFREGIVNSSSKEEIIKLFESV
ncbi:PTS sugar transporter subunit IIA [Virgibacillus halophilus]|uniref:PTS sugar transporter subunit IIA n=1 Tax=Tigheibacillus halophilus TaxID=361280 RepID=UPI00363AED4D